MQILDDFLTNIANAIRKRKQITNLIKANDFASEIESIPQESASDLQTKEITITSNGTTTLNPDANYDGISSATITTNVQPALQSKSATLTSSSGTTVSPDSGYYGLSKVTVTPNLQTKSANCTSTSAVSVTADSGYVGLSKVTVTPVTETRTHNVTANGTTTVNVNSGKVGMTKVTVTTNVSSSLSTANRVNYCQEYGAGSVELARECIIPAKSNMIYVVTCISAASNAGDPTVTFDSRTGCTYTWISNSSTSSQINGVVGMKFTTQFWRISNTSGAQQATYIRSKMTENRGLIVSNIYS